MKRSTYMIRQEDITTEEIREDNYNRAIYFPINNESGKAMAQSAKDTILDINGIGCDKRDYHVLLNNCDMNARTWMQAGDTNRNRGTYSTK